MPEPQGCAACGRPERGHGDAYTRGIGGHYWTAPDNALVLRRMKERRTMPDTDRDAQSSVDAIENGADL